MHQKILIVEDDSDTAVLFREALRRRGLDVDDVRSAPECLERLRSTPADVVIVDVHMAGMSGIELCEQLREHYPDTLTIVVTAAVTLDTWLASNGAGAFDFLTKPVKFDVLLGAVNRALDHHSLRSAIKQRRASREAAT